MGRNARLRIALRKVTHFFDANDRLSWIHCLCLLTAVVMLSCGYASAPKTTKPLADRLREPVPHDRYADDVGRFLAGLPARPDSTLAKFQDTPAWAKHREDLDSAWAKMDDQRLPAMRAFQKAEF